MTNARLILIDGLPGSGKSSTAEFLADQFTRNGVLANWIWESEQGHPLHAWGDFQHEWFDSLDKRDAAEFVESSLEKWRAFAEEKSKDKAITIVECFPFQNAVLFLLLMNAGEATMSDYVQRFAKLTKRLQPVLLYFHHADAAGAMRRSVKERGDAFDTLLQKFNTTPYGCRHGLSGNGYLTFFAEYAHSINRLFDEWPLPKLLLDADENDWPKRRRQALNYLGLPAPAAIALRESDYIGRYLEEGGDKIFTVALEDGLLMLRFYHIVAKLIPSAADEFSISGMRYLFERDTDGTVQRLTVSSKKGIFRSARKLP